LGATRPTPSWSPVDGFFVSRRVQFAVLSVRHAIPAMYAVREYPEAGGLMSMGPMLWTSGIRSASTPANPQGAKPADLPVLQSTKFEFVINMQTARALGIEVPNSIQLLADEVIE